MIKGYFKHCFPVTINGNRRFLPITVFSNARDIYENMKEVKHDIEQCWAEAYYRYNKGDLAPVNDKKIDKVFAEQQKSAMVSDYRIGIIGEWLNSEKTRKTVTCVIEVWEEALKMGMIKPTAKDSKEIGKILRMIPGWNADGFPRRYGKYGLQKTFSREGWEWNDSGGN